MKLEPKELLLLKCLYLYDKIFFFIFAHPFNILAFHSIKSCRISQIKSHYPDLLNNNFLIKFCHRYTHTNYWQQWCDAWCHSGSANENPVKHFSHLNVLMALVGHSDHLRDRSMCLLANFWYTQRNPFNIIFSLFFVVCTATSIQNTRKYITIVVEIKFQQLRHFWNFQFWTQQQYYCTYLSL